MSLPITTITKTFVHVMRSGSSSGSLNKYNPMNGRSKWDANQPQACDVDCEQVWVWNTLEICNNLCIVCALHAVQRVPFFPLKLYITHTGHIEGFSIFIDRIQEFEENWKVSCALWWGKWFFHHNVMTIRFKVINSTLKSSECKSFNDARANHIGYLLSLSLFLALALRFSKMWMGLIQPPPYTIINSAKSYHCSSVEFILYFQIYMHIFIQISSLQTALT